MSSSSRSSNTTNNDIKNYNLQGVTGETVIAGNGNSVTSTDYGAIAGAFDLAKQTVGSNQIVSMAAMEQSADVAEMGMGYVFDAAKMSVNAAGEAVYAVGNAWRDSSKMAVDAAGEAAYAVGNAWRDSSTMAVRTATDAAAMIADASSTNIDRISTINKNASDRVERLAVAVATDGQNLITQNNKQNLYVVAGVSVAAVVGMALLARSK